jgi:hypothetical protein
MGEFEQVFEDCIKKLAEGESIKSCLTKYPGFQEDLRELLLLAKKLQSVLAVNTPARLEEKVLSELVAQTKVSKNMASRPACLQTKLAAKGLGWWGVAIGLARVLVVPAKEISQVLTGIKEFAEKGNGGKKLARKVNLVEELKNKSLCISYRSILAKQTRETKGLE